jgi:hypothetical protein
MKHLEVLESAFVSYEIARHSFAWSIKTAHLHTVLPRVRRWAECEGTPYPDGQGVLRQQVAGSYASWEVSQRSVASGG